MKKDSMAIKAVIFDIGGVVINWHDDIAYRHVARITGMPVKRVEKAGDRYMKLFDEGKITESGFWRRVEESVHYRGGLRENWLEHYDSFVERNKAVVSLIKKLRKKGYCIVALTNVIRPHYRYNKKTGLYRLFDRVFASCQLRMRKPNRNIYMYVIRKMKIKPGECIFIDNEPENVAAARKLGICAFVFRNAAQMKREMKKYGIRV